MTTHKQIKTVDALTVKKTEENQGKIREGKEGREREGERERDNGWMRKDEREREQNESHRRCKKNVRKGKSVLA